MEYARAAYFQNNTNLPPGVSEKDFHALLSAFAEHSLDDANEETLGSPADDPSVIEVGEKTHKTANHFFDVLRSPLQTLQSMLGGGGGGGVAPLTAVVVEGDEQSSALEKRVLAESAYEEQRKQRIEEYMEANSFRVYCVLKTGLPFSKLGPKVTSKILRSSLSTIFSSTVSPLIHLLSSDDSITTNEAALNEKYGAIFEELPIEEVRKCCYDLTHIVLQKNDPEAAFYLLWIIKYLGKCDFTIPPITEFTPDTLQTVLNDYFESKTSTCHNPVTLCKLMLSSSGRDPFIFQVILNQTSGLRFFHFQNAQLRSIPWENWPDKGNDIVDMLHTLGPERRPLLAAIVGSLYRSDDPKTRTIGEHLDVAFTATTLRDAIPHFSALSDICTHFNPYMCEQLFGKPFPTMELRRSSSIPPFACKLSFNRGRVFSIGDLVIGTYRPTGNVDVPPHLLAFNIHTEQMVWGIPLTPDLKGLSNDELVASQSNHTGRPLKPEARCHLHQNDDQIILQFKKHGVIFQVCGKTGTVNKIALPCNGMLHCTKNGYIYQMTRPEGIPTLVCGKFNPDGSFDESFQMTSFAGPPTLLSTHLSFFDDYENTINIIGPTGGRKDFSCFSAYAAADSLYLVLPNPDDPNTCVLTVQTLNEDETVFSDPEKTIPLPVKAAKIKCLCDTGELILLNERNGETIYVSMDDSTVTLIKDSPIGSCMSTTIDPKTGDIWTFSGVSNGVFRLCDKVWKDMGILASGTTTSLVRADSGKLFVVYNPS